MGSPYYDPTVGVVTGGYPPASPFPQANPAGYQYPTAIVPPGAGPQPAIPQYPPPTELALNPPPAPPTTPMASTALQPAGNLSTGMPDQPYPPAPAVPSDYATDTGGFGTAVPATALQSNTVDMQRAMNDPAYRAQIMGDTSTMPGGGLPPAQPSPQTPVWSPTNPLPLQTASEEAVARGVPLKQVIQERMNQEPPAEQPAPTTQTGGPAVSVPTPTSAISEPPTYTPTELRLRGARGDNPSTAFGDDAGYPPVTPKVMQSATRYNQFANDDPLTYEAINSVAKQLGMPAVDLFNMAYALSGVTKDGKISLDLNNVMNLTPQQMAESDPANEHSRDPSDVLQNLFLGGKRYMYWRDYFGQNTASAIAAMKYDPQQIGAAATMLSGNEQEQAFKGYRDFVHLATGNDADDPKSAIKPPGNQPGAAPPSAAPPSAAAPSGAEGAGGPTPTSAPGARAPGAPPSGDENAPPLTAPGATTPQPGATNPPPRAPAVTVPPHVPPLGTPPGSVPAASTQPPGPTTGTPTAPPAPVPVPPSGYSSPSTPPYQLSGGGSVTPAGLQRAGAQGPQSFMTYMVNNSPSGMNTGDMWRRAATTLSQAFILRGDMQGAQRAQEFVFQQAHVGSVQALMQAYTAFQGGQGDLVSTAQLLAKAHAFFPDGTAGGFQVVNGQIWGERFDEETGKQIGNPFLVTNEMLAGALNVTMDPQKWLETLRSHQQLVETVRHNRMQEGIELRGQDVTQRGQNVTMADVQEQIRSRLEYQREREEDRLQMERERTEARNEQVRLQVEQRAEAARERLAIGLANQAKESQARMAEIDRTSDAYFGSGSMNNPDVAGWTLPQRSAASTLYRGFMTADPNANQVAAYDMAIGLQQPIDPKSGQPTGESRYQVRPSPDGTAVAIVDRANPNHSHALIPMNQAIRFGLVPPPRPQSGMIPPPASQTQPATALQG